MWFYRHDALRQPADLLHEGVLPVLGGVMLLGAFIIASYQYAAPDYGNTTLFGIGGVFVIGIGALLLGVVLMFIWNASRPPSSGARPCRSAAPRPRSC